MAAGTAAGFAAAYNTPFAAFLFVLETIVGMVAMEALLPTMVATLIATAISGRSSGVGLFTDSVHSLRARQSSSRSLPVVAAVAAFAFKYLLGAV